MDAANDVERLREVGLFGGLSDGALEGLARAHAIVELNAGDFVFREGEPGREMFVVLDGEVELFRTVRGAEVPVALVSRNDWFGEMSILDILPRPTSARVAVRAGLLRLTAHDLDVLYRKDLKCYTLFVLNIAREMSRRLRIADAVVANMNVAASALQPTAR
jgi:CRP/FNR family cyclic AMP-dependent transcriptional regulator